MSNKELAVYEKKVYPLAEEADALEIKSPDDMKTATELLSKLNKQMDAVEEEEDKVLKPLKEAVKAEQSRWKPFKEALKPAIDSLRKRMGAYQTKADEEAAKKKAKIAERIGEGKGKLKIETAIKKSEEVTGPEATVATESGMVKFRTDRKFEVTDLSKLPIEYHLANEVLIRKMMKEGTELPGVRYWDEKVPVNSR